MTRSQEFLDPKIECKKIGVVAGDGFAGGNTFLLWWPIEQQCGVFRAPVC